MSDRSVLWWMLRVAFCLGLLTVGWLSLAPPAQVSFGFHVSDKLGHLAAYAALGFTATALGSPVAKLALSIAVAAFGIAMEAAQESVVGRSAELADVVANGLGLLAGLLVALAFERLMSRRFVPTA